MSRPLTLVASAAALLLGAAPATAQDDPEIGSRLTQRRVTGTAVGEDAAARAAQRYAGCVFLKQPSQVVAALSVTDPADAGRRLGALQVRGTCMNLILANSLADSQRLSFPTDLYRGLLAEAVIRNRYQGAKLTALPLQTTYSRPWFAITGRPRPIEEMNACVADTNPDGIATLLTTAPQSDSERMAVRRMGSSLGPCLSAATKLSSNRQSLRAGLAEALFHRLTAPTVAGVVK